VTGARTGPLALVFVAAACESRTAPPPPEPTPVPPPTAPVLVAFRPDPPALAPELVELGRLLFFDPRLSRHNDMSCATCHDPDKGWTDGLATARGVGGKPLPRNTPTVVNIDHRLPLFWDGRAATAEAQALNPIGNPDEMAEDLEQLVSTELAAIPEYRARFRRAFPDTGLTKDNLAAALAAFERSLLSHDAPLDRYLAGDTAAMSADAIAGMALFVGKAKCSKCHGGAQLTDNSFHNIGIRGADAGRFAILDLPVLKGAFKTPGLRDVALTAPYLHDGSATTLEAVVELYDRGGDVRDNLDPDITPLNLAPAERAQLVAFMQALTATTPVRVDKPRLPGHDPRNKRAKLQTFMQQADEMLEMIDALLASINDRDWSEMAKRAESLVDIAEELDVSRGPKVPTARWPEFREKQGDLILAIIDLQRAIARKSAADTHTSYREVRATCDRCHELFRPDFDAPASP
jgi:cytochrome c peroxidase